MLLALSTATYCMFLVFLSVSMWLTERRCYATSSVIDMLSGTTAIIGAVAGLIDTLALVDGLAEFPPGAVSMSTLLAGAVFVGGVHLAMAAIGVYRVMFSIKRASLEDRAKDIDQKLIDSLRKPATT